MIQLMCSYKYYARIIRQMAIKGYHQTYFVVFTNKDIVEYLEFDKECWKKLLSLIVFFKTYAQPYRYHTKFFLPDVQQPMLELKRKTVSTMIHVIHGCTGDVLG